MVYLGSTVFIYNTERKMNFGSIYSFPQKEKFPPFYCTEVAIKQYALEDGDAFFDVSVSDADHFNTGPR